VAKFPAFCNESGASFSVDDACKRELAALFAVTEHKSNHLRNVVDDSACAGGTDCPRGPLGLVGDSQYSGFSSVFYEGFDTSERLLS